MVLSYTKKMDYEVWVVFATIVEENGMNLRNLKLLKNCSKCGKTFTTLLRFKKVGFHVCYRCKTK